MLRKIQSALKSSIQNKLIAAFLLAWILPLAVITLILYGGFYGQLIENERHTASVLAETANLKLREMTQQAEDIITSALLNTNIIEALKSSAEPVDYEWFLELKRIDTLLSSIAIRSDKDYSVTIIGHEGKHYSYAGTVNENLSLDSPLVQAIVERGGTVTVNRQEEGFEGGDFLTIGRCVFDSGELLGVILVDIPLDSLDEIYESYDSENYMVFLSDRKGHPVYVKGTDKLEEDIVESVLARTQDGVSALSINGETYLNLTGTASSGSTQSLILVKENYLFRSSRFLIFRFFTAFLLVMAAGLAAIVFISRKIGGEIKKLSTATEVFGRTGKPIELSPSTADEVGQLTEAFVVLSHRVNDLLEKTKQDERHKKLLEMKALQTQVNPHMIYNTLNTITNMAQIYGVWPIEQVSSSFADLLRLISKTEGSFLRIGDELNFIRSYVNLKKYNMLWDVRLQLDVPPGVQDFKILKLLIQPLVENSLIHGLAEADHEGVIRICFRKQDGRITFLVEDNGSGMEPSVIESVLSGKYRGVNTFINVGIGNTLERLKTQYQEEYTFSICSEKAKGTTIEISYPILPEERGESDAESSAD